MELIGEVGEVVASEIFQSRSAREVVIGVGEENILSLFNGVSIDLDRDGVDG